MGVEGWKGGRMEGWLYFTGLGWMASGAMARRVWRLAFGSGRDDVSAEALAKEEAFRSRAAATFNAAAANAGSATGYPFNNNRIQASASQCSNASGDQPRCSTSSE
jgi:hypothetical protein